MAGRRNPVVEVLIRAKDLTATALAKFRRNFRETARTIRNAVLAVAAFTVAIAGSIAALTKLAQRGSEVNAVKRTFAKITGDEVAALELLREATKNTVDDQTLMVAHNQALALGAAESTESFAKMAETARILGRAQGLDAATALEKFTVGLARQSRLRLDDLGIVLQQEEANRRYAETLGRQASDLTESERKIAFRNEALRQADILVRRLSGGEDEAGEASDRFAASILNLKDKIATLVSESPLVAEFFNALTGFVDDWIEILASDAELIEDAFASLGRIAGNAFSIAVSETISGAMTSTIGELVERWEDFISDRFPSLREGLEENRSDFVARQEAARDADPRRAAIGAELEALDALAEAARARNEIRARERQANLPETIVPGARTIDLASLELPGITGPALGGAGLAGGVPVSRARRAFLEAQANADPNAINVPEVSPLEDFPLEDLEEVTDTMDRAGEVAVASFGAAAAAAIRGSGQIAESVISMITQIGQSLAGGGLLGSVIGAVGGIGLALLTKRDRKVPVSVESYGSSALDDMRRIQGPLRVTTIIEQGGKEIARIERDLFDRQSRDEVQRYGADGLALRNARR